jgi:hypothetical protein
MNMEIPWNVVLPDKSLQTKLNKKLNTVVKPFTYMGIGVGTFFMIGMAVNSIHGRRWANPDQLNADLTGSAVISCGIIGAIITLILPNQVTNVVLTFRFLSSVGLCYTSYGRF